MKRIETGIYALCLLMALSSVISCSENKQEVHKKIKEYFEFVVQRPDSMADWKESESVSLFELSEYRENCQFSICSTQGRSATISGFCTEPEMLYSLCPYAPSNAFDGRRLLAVLPSAQTAKAGSMEPGYSHSAAVSSDRTLEYVPLFAQVSVDIPEYEKGAVESITLKGNNGEILSGSYYVDVFSEDGLKAQVFNDANAYVEMVGQISSGSRYNFSILPGSFPKGFKIDIRTSNGKTFIRSFADAVQVAPGATFNLPEFSLFDPKDESLDLTASGTANCYVVNESRYYSIKAVKGNSDEALSDAVGARVVWETFGTLEQPMIGDLISDIFYDSGAIYFKTADEFRDGNALVAAVDKSGNILWSWHIWCLKDGFSECVYANSAGTLMDRNLGATSIEPGNVGTFGLFYQWGRKDPFLAPATTNTGETTFAKATVAMTVVTCDKTNGSIDYTIKHPTYFLSSTGKEWLLSVSGVDNTRWQETKTIYDPCPVGWQVPSAGDNSIWAKAGCIRTMKFDSVNKGVMFSTTYCTPESWYPIPGYIAGKAVLQNCGNRSHYWTVTPNNDSATRLNIANNAVVEFAGGQRPMGLSVRCVKTETNLVYLH